MPPTPSSAVAKVCGLSTPEAVQAAIQGGTAYIGFVFFAPSPRNIGLARAAALAEPARAAGVKIVAVTVDADDAQLHDIAWTLRPDFIQLHGAETPARVAEIKARTGVDVIRALRLATPGDLDEAALFSGVADHLMFDAKAPPDAPLPGGNGAAFDWSILTARRFAKPWFLAGGLTPANVAGAVTVSGAPLVDVSSGVETAPGVKDPALIKAFLEAVRGV